MSSLSQPYTSHSTKGFSAPHLNNQTKPRSNSKSNPASSISTPHLTDKQWTPVIEVSKDMPSFSLQELSCTDYLSYRHWIDGTPESYLVFQATKILISAVLDLHYRIRESASVSWLVQDDKLISDLLSQILELENRFSGSLSVTLQCRYPCTTKTEELHTDGKTPYQRLKNKKKRKMFLCEGRTYRRTFERYKLQKEPRKLQRDYMIGEGTFEATDQPESNLFHPIGTNTMIDRLITHGQFSLMIWKCTAGKSKSWKRFPKCKAPKQTHHRQMRRNQGTSEHQFAKSSLWLPATFLRSQAKKKSLRLGHVVWRQGSDSVPERARRYDPHVHNFEDATVTPYNQYSTAKMDQDTGIWASGIMIVEDVSQEPADAFVRFTWKDKILINGVGQLDRFLPIGMVFRNRWCVNGFLRNESFADVYSLSKVPLVRSLPTDESSQEAHVFLDEYHGNCAVYARRLRNRMLQSGDCLDAFLYGGRRVTVMRVQQKPVEFRLRNTDEEFPILGDQNKCKEQVALRRRRFRGKPSFAAVAGERWPGIGSDYQPMSVSKGKSALEKELESIEKVRLKKAEKQRAKRQSQRDKRVAEKLHNTEETKEAKRAFVKVHHSPEFNTNIMCKQSFQPT